MKKTLLSGVKPTGRPHIGNYFGAMKQFVDLQNSGDYECYFMIANYHALNFIQNKEDMHRLTLDLALDYLALGLDPKKSILFKQSDVSAHTELAWIFDTIVTMPFLMRAHAFKDAEAKDKEISVGTFNYPVLMATDILLYSPDVVPVGQDQKQHVEYARDIAEKFNYIFCHGKIYDIPAGPSIHMAVKDTPHIFKLPEPLIMKEVATVPGIDGRKMSKSYGNTISLFATREEITKAVMGIVTDSNAVLPVNVMNIHALFVNDENRDRIKLLYKENAGKYKILKEALIEDIDAFIKPLREKRAKLAMDESAIIEMLDEGGKRAAEKANKKLHAVKQAIGVSL